jgi:septal ring factor EnvC (AmiA/AmiB activator)
MRKLNTKKNKITLFIFSLLYLCLINTGDSFAQKQSKKYLENKKKELQQEIEYTNKLLDETKKNKRSSLNQLITLNRKISARQELISTINGEINLLDNQITKNNQSINALYKDLQKLKAEYAKMIYYAYKNQNSYNKLMFVFASNDFEQAFMRLKYLQQYSEYRTKQASLIVKTKTDLDYRTKNLEVKKNEKRSLLTNEVEEKEKLFSEKTEKEEIVVHLQTQESELKKELQKKKKDAEKFEQAILRIIQQELEKAQKEAETQNKQKPQKLVLTPEAQDLSNSFANNKNKLPWPVEKGFISEHFGVHEHPLIPNIDVNNNGVDITTSNGSLTRAVFEGEVKAIVNMPGAGRFILIRHGEYLTIYSNLKDVYVKVGDKVKTKQKIASILFDDKDANTVLHFELWKGQTKLDPENWLYSNN